MMGGPPLFPKQPPGAESARLGPCRPRDRRRGAVRCDARLARALRPPGHDVAPAGGIRGRVSPADDARRRGLNHLNATTAIDYARQPSLTQEGRVLRQQSLMRAVRKIAMRNLLTNPITMNRVLHALISMLTVDSNFTNSELEHLAKEVGDSERPTDYVTAGTHEVPAKSSSTGISTVSSGPRSGRTRSRPSPGVPLHRDTPTPVGDPAEGRPRVDWGARSLRCRKWRRDDVQRRGSGGRSAPRPGGPGRPRRAAGLTIGGCLYINHVAAGIARVPVMFAPSQTPTAPR